MSQMHLFSDRRFWPLFWTQFFGALNDNVFKNALIIFIAFKGISIFGLPPASVVALGGGVFILPFFLFSAQAGYLADKFEKSRLIKIIKVAEIVLMALGAAFLVTGQIELLLLILFAMGTQSTYFGPVKYSILPQLVSEDDLVGANAVVEAGTFLAILLGTIIGGVSIAGEHGSVIVAAEVIGFAVCGWLTSLYVVRLTPSDPTVTVPFEPLSPTLRIIREARPNRPVFLSIMGISWFWFLGAAMLTLFPNYAKDILHGDESVVTWMLALFSLGICAGSLLCERMSRRMLELGLVPLGTIGMTVFLFDLFLAGRPTGLAASNWTGFLSTFTGQRISADLFLFSLFGGFYIVPLYTLIQQRSETRDRSRIIAANNIINAIFMVVASVMLMVFATRNIDAPSTFLILATMNVAVSLFVYAQLPEFLYRFFCWTIVKCLYRMNIVNHERIPTEGPALLALNHVSFIDWMIVASASKRPVRIIMDHAFMNSPVVRFLYREARVIPIAPKHENADILAEAWVRIGEELKAGEIVAIFPEGMITHDGEMNEFKRGIEKILQENPCPVIPIAIRGMWGSFFSRYHGKAMSKPFRRFLSKITLNVGEAIMPQNVTAAGLQTVIAGLRGDEC
jgi:hypothetical protein